MIEPGDRENEFDQEKQHHQPKADQTNPNHKSEELRGRDDQRYPTINGQDSEDYCEHYQNQIDNKK
jgi:hypothetical protein